MNTSLSTICSYFNFVIYVISISCCGLNDTRPCFLFYTVHNKYDESAKQSNDNIMRKFPVVDYASASVDVSERKTESIW